MEDKKLETSRRCTYCEQSKNKTSFSRGCPRYRNTCDECFQEAHRRYIETREPVRVGRKKLLERECKNCELVQPRENFNHSGRYRLWCDTCYADRPIKKKEPWKNKVCRLCNEEKPREKFSYTGKRYHHCSDCVVSVVPLIEKN